MVVKSSCLYLHDGFADWEAAFILPELNNKSPHKVKTVAATLAPVTSMGGLRVTPDTTLDSLDPASVAVFILPGGEDWVDAAANAAVMQLLPRLRERGIPLAAICGATLAFARLGFLDTVAHTSNMPGFLETFAPAYAGGARYRADALAVTDGGIVTASGIGALEFAYEIIKLLNIYNRQTARQWFDLFKSGAVPPPEFWSRK